MKIYNRLIVQCVPVTVLIVYPEYILLSTGLPEDPGMEYLSLFQSMNLAILTRFSFKFAIN